MNYLIYPSGILLSVYFEQGIIDNYMVAYEQNNFISCYHYLKGIKDGLQYSYDIQEKLLVVSVYRKGKLVEIRDGQLG